MKTYKRKGLYGEGDAYLIESLEDFDYYTKMYDEDFLNVWLRNLPLFKEDFKNNIGKHYKENNKTYKLIAMEDDDPNADWYWVAENVEDKTDIKYFLVNDSEFYEGLFDLLTTEPAKETNNTPTIAEEVEKINRLNDK